MLIDTFRTMVNNLFKKKFLWEKKEKIINILITFSISHKNSVKTFLK